MHEKWSPNGGMSDLLGPMTFGKKNEEVFLGREIQSSRDYSEVTARMIDEEISRIVRESQRFADEILRKDIDILHSIAKELLKYETIDAKDLEKILKGEKLTRSLNGSSTQKMQKKSRRQYTKRNNNRRTKAQKLDIEKKSDSNHSTPAKDKKADIKT